MTRTRRNRTRIPLSYQVMHQVMQTGFPGKGVCEDFFVHFVLLWRLVEFLTLPSAVIPSRPYLHVNHREMPEQPLGISILTSLSSHSSGTSLVSLVTLTGHFMILRKTLVSWQLSPKCCQQLLTPLGLIKIDVCLWVIEFLYRVLQFSKVSYT